MVPLIRNEMTGTLANKARGPPCGKDDRSDQGVRLSFDSLHITIV